MIVGAANGSLIEFLLGLCFWIVVGLRVYCGCIEEFYSGVWMLCWVA